jgi:hypothetical protein
VSLQTPEKIQNLRMRLYADGFQDHGTPALQNLAPPDPSA